MPITEKEIEKEQLIDDIICGLKILGPVERHAFFVLIDALSEKEKRREKEE